jgi:orotate phosphoribosyltransferase
VKSCLALRALGAEVDRALGVIDRRAGGVEALAAIGVRLQPLLKASELQETMLLRDALEGRVRPAPTTRNLPPLKKSGEVVLQLISQTGER